MRLCEKIYNDIKAVFGGENPELEMRSGEDWATVRKCKEWKFIEDYRSFADAHVPAGINPYYSHSLSLKLLGCIEQADISLNDDYLVVTARIPKNSVTLELDTRTKKYQVKAYASKKKSYIIRDNGSVFTSKSVSDTTKGFYATTLNDLRYLPKEIAEVIMANLSGDSLLYKDFLVDEFFAPLPLSELKNLHNKREYFQKQFPKVAFPKPVGTYKCGELYAIGCAAEYIVPEQIPLLFQKEYRVEVANKGSFSKRFRKEIGTNRLKDIIEKRTQSESWKSRDYVDMAVGAKEKIDITGGRKALTARHDRLSAQVLERTLKKKCGSKPFVFAETPLKYLELPQEFVRLNTTKALCTEAAINHNCVHGYTKRIVSGTCVVYSADINDEHLTIEIRKRGKNKLYVRQCYVSYNRLCKEETLAYVKRCVEEAAPQAFATFAKKQKGKKVAV